MTLGVRGTVHLYSCLFLGNIPLRCMWRYYVQVYSSDLDGWTKNFTPEFNVTLEHLIKHETLTLLTVLCSEKNANTSSERDRATRVSRVRSLLEFAVIAKKQIKTLIFSFLSSINTNLMIISWVLTFAINCANNFMDFSSKARLCGQTSARWLSQCCPNWWCVKVLTALISGYNYFLYLEAGNKMWP